MNTFDFNPSQLTGSMCIPGGLADAKTKSEIDLLHGRRVSFTLLHKCWDTIVFMDFSLLPVFKAINMD